MVVYDGGIFFKMGFMIVNIMVGDINDNYLIFLKFFYNVIIMDDFFVEFVVVKIFVSDKDEGINGEV